MRRTHPVVNLTLGNHERQMVVAMGIRADD